MKNIAKATLILSILFLTAQTASAFGAVDWLSDDSYPGTGSYTAVDNKLAQSFEFGTKGYSGNWECNAIMLPLSIDASIAGNDITVELCSGSGNPSGLATMDTGTITSSQYTGNTNVLRYYVVEMDDGDTLIDGNDYTIILTTPITSSVAWRTEGEQNSDQYTQGDAWRRYSGTWYKTEATWPGLEDKHDCDFWIMHNFSGANVTGAVENIEETSATFNYDQFYDSGNYTETTIPMNPADENYMDYFGFWYGTTYPVTEGNKEGNVSDFDNPTLSSTTDKTHPSKNIPSLISGQYYYIQTWVQDRQSGEFRTTTNNYTFLTKPNPPTSLSVTGRNATNITLSWSNSTTGVNNQTTLIVYKTGSYPSSPTDGTIGYNGTATTTIITGLSSDTEYKFSAFTYINATGSPYYWWFSDTYDTVASSTVSGNFNITFKWECNHTLIDNTTTDFQNSTLWAETYYGEQVYYNNTITENPMSFDITEDFNIFYLDYNNSGQIRSIIPSSTSDSGNITFFVCCYDKYTTGYNYSDSQVYYTFSFDDRTPDNRFITSNQSELHLYKYNSTGKYFIHQDYFDAQDKVGVYLHFGERYFLGVKCPSLSIPQVQYIDTDTNIDKEIKIIPEQERIYTLYDFVNINTSYDSGIWLNYTDISFSTEYVNISIYNTSSNGTKTLVHQYNFTTNTKNYRWVDANESYTYTVEFTINNTIIGEEQTKTIYLLGSIGTGTITNTDWINTQWNNVLTIPFDITITQLLSFILSFIILISVGIKNSSVGFILAGSSLILLNGVIFFESSATTLGSVVLGIVFITLGLLFARGEIQENNR